MSKYASPSFSILVDGYDLTPVLVESESASHEILTQPTAPFGTESEEHTPVGVSRDTLGVGGGIFDQAVDPLHHGRIPDGGVGVSRIVCFTQEGQTAGQSFTGYEGAYSQQSTALMSNGKLTKANVRYQPSGQSDRGVILQPLASKTADWNTESTPYDIADDPGSRHIDIVSVSQANPSVVTTVGNHGLVTGDVVALFSVAGGITPDVNDNPAAAETWKLIGHSITVTGLKTFTIPVNVTNDGTGGYCVLVSRASGGVGYQQVTQGSGFTNFVGKIRHSADNSSWADLITFADTTTTYHAKERKATATTTTRWNRYWAYDGNVTGSVGATPFKVFAGFAPGV